jgi:hypothetical protein
MRGAMRAGIRWIAAVVVGVSACGGGSAQRDGGGGVDGGGAPDISIGTGGTGGGITDGGGVDLPISIGNFPYSGRWWANLTEGAADGGSSDVLPFVIHWNATDPADRALWTLVEVVPMAVTPAPDGSTIVRHAARGTSGCWAIYATSDPDALDVRACSTPQSSSAPLFGTFRRGPRLVAQIPKSPLPAPDGYAPQLQINGGDMAGSGDWVTFGIGPRVWLWKRDTGQAFDLGPGGGARVSPDGRRAMYGRSTPGAQVPSLLVFDTATGETTDLTTLVPIKPTAQYGSGGFFSPDGSKIAIRANIPISGTGDLLVYDFATRKTTMVAPGVTGIASVSSGQKDVFLASGDHLIYVGYDAALPSPVGPATLNGYELSTGKYVSFGPAGDLVEFPGKRYAGLRTSADGLVLIDDATFTPRVIATLVSGGQYIGGGGLVPSPDGTEVAYTDAQGVLNVRDVASGTTTAIANGVGCIEVPNPLSFAGSGQTRVIAAIFTPDGALVYNVAEGCGGGVHGLGRYDRATRTEKLYTSIHNGTRYLAMSPFGGFVFEPGALPTLLAWPGPPVVLEPVVPMETFSQDATFVFSAADRYLTYTSNGFLMARDNRSGTVKKVAPIGGIVAKTFTSPVSGVTVPYGYGSTVTAYLPDGTSRQVASRTTGMLANPTTTKVVYEGDGGISVLPLEPGATPTLIGNRFLLVVTGTQVLFQDVDGICAASL